MPRKIYRMCSIKVLCWSWWTAAAKDTARRCRGGDPHGHYWFPTKRDPVEAAPGETYAAAYVREWTARNHLK